MTPVVSSFAIYLITILSSIKLFACISFAVLCVSPVFVMCWAYESQDGVAQTFKRLKPYYIKLFIFTILCMIFIPDKNTLLTMLVVSYITPDNINLVEGHIADFVLNIIQAVKDVNP